MLLKYAPYLSHEGDPVNILRQNHDHEEGGLLLGLKENSSQP